MNKSTFLRATFVSAALSLGLVACDEPVEEIPTAEAPPALEVVEQPVEEPIAQDPLIDELEPMNEVSELTEEVTDPSAEAEAPAQSAEQAEAPAAE